MNQSDNNAQTPLERRCILIRDTLRDIEGSDNLYGFDSSKQDHWQVALQTALKTYAFEQLSDSEAEKIMALLDLITEVRVRSPEEWEAYKDLMMKLEPVGTSTPAAAPSAPEPAPLADQARALAEKFAKAAPAVVAPTPTPEKTWPVHPTPKGGHVQPADAPGAPPHGSLARTRGAYRCKCAACNALLNRKKNYTVSDTTVVDESGITIRN